MEIRLIGSDNSFISLSNLVITSYSIHYTKLYEGTLHLARTNAHFLGGGKALMNAYYAKAATLGVAVIYEADVCDLEICDGKFDSAIFESQGALQKVRAKSVVVASGGFQANLTWLKECWGEAVITSYSIHYTKLYEAAPATAVPGRKDSRG